MDSGLLASLGPGMTILPIAALLYNDAARHLRSFAMSVAEQHVGKPAVSLKDADFNWEDPLDLES